MKKLIVGLAVGLLLAVLLVPSSAQRGDLYGARALLALEQAFKTTGVLTFPNYAAAPVVCNAANRGVYYYDTTLTDARVCGAAGWATIFGGFTVGTAATLPMWNAVPDDLVDSSLSDDGTDVLAVGGLFTSGTAVGAVSSVLLDGNNSALVFEGGTADGFEGYIQGGDFLGGTDLVITLGNPAAGVTGDLMEIVTTLAAMDGNDSQAGISIELTDADHTGANNFQAGVDVWGIIGDDQATSRAFQGGVGWDAILWANTAVLTMGSDLNYISFLDDTLGIPFAFDLEHDPTANHTWQWIIADVAIMTADDFITRGLWVDLLNANHTNAGGNDNFIRGIDVDGIVQDPDAIEHAIEIGAGWDQAIHIDDGSVTDDRIVFGVGNDSSIYWNNGGVRLEINNSATAGGHILFNSSNTAAILAYWQSGGNAMMDLQNRPVAGTSRDMLVLGRTAYEAMNGADTTSFYTTRAWTDPAHTGGELANSTHGFQASPITSPDLDALHVAFIVEAGWDVAFSSTGTTVDIDHGLTAHVLLAPTLAANDDAADQRNVMLIDVDIPNGSGGLVNGINIDAITDDVDTIDSAIMIEGGWDSALTIFERGSVATSNPLTGSIYIYLDDSADYSGGGGNDCWLVVRDNAGNNHELLQIILDGACP